MQECMRYEKGRFKGKKKQVEGWQEVKEGRGDVREEEDEGMRERKSLGEEEKRVCVCVCFC